MNTATSTLDTILSTTSSARELPTRPMPLREVLNRIRSGTWRAPVENVRALRAKKDAAKGSPEEAEAERAWSASKTSLPAMILAVNTKTRAKDATPEQRQEKATGLLQVDLDHMPDMPDMRAKLQAMPCVVAVWTSPSGDGLKAVARVEGGGDPELHRRAFMALDDELHRRLGVRNDEKVKDPARLCFMSYDPDLWMREEEPELLALPPAPAPSASSVEIAQPIAAPKDDQRPAPQPPDTRDRTILERIGRIHAVSGNGGHNATMKAARALVTGFALPTSEAMRLLVAWNRTNAHPPWSDSELMHKLESVQNSAPLMPIGCMWSNPNQDIPEPLEVLSALDLMGKHKELRAPIVDGLLREGETMNIIGSPKTGKTFLALCLALKVANGQPFFGRTTARGPVYIVDNELHGETLSFRLRGVCEESGLSPEGLHFSTLRGRLQDIEASARLLVQAAKACKAKVMILDALYRFLPEGVSENDNAGVMRVFNVLDRIAMESGAAIVNIHHASKGNQGEKNVTDGGAGAGAIARAADAHLFVREHEDSPSEHGMEEQWATVQYVVRSWPPGKGWVMGKRKDSKLWYHVEDADPERVKGRKPKPRKWTADMVLSYVPEEPAMVSEIMERIEQDGEPFKGGERALRAKLNLLADRQPGDKVRVYKTEGESGQNMYSTGLPPDGPVRQRLRAKELMQEHPGMSDAEVADRIGCHLKTVQRAKAELKRDLKAAKDNPEPEVF